VLPEQENAVVRRLRSEGRVVAMVGAVPVRVRSTRLASTERRVGPLQSTKADRFLHTTVADMSRETDHRTDNTTAVTHHTPPGRRLVCEGSQVGGGKAG
jgi:hypothetical protein